ncbi:outer membrane lipoprotein-sorting protein [candidate division KSB1 bacterium]|nr:outer membrane lipoprotein-sorting protein [candidate division KSB1 bacterium]NIR72766.1 outer membrane lipoprotein-sorting protein [candidate division KSB1 bacterium]NIS23722.1 outer membrane lipoprotein-sorting protein [candidate division KSB1 bacterium]NIT70642.1 outer membrane lipoprotein-sorting protein [candidate division KSB1 bacterium]NIU24370.1 outer membrane lipoprotein-sorting protein [candidate division KSB1 bacterium]
MNRIIGFLFLFAVSVLSGFAQESARSIVKKSDDLMRGETQVGTYTMTVIRPEWQRKMKFKFWSKGTEKAFIRMLEPAKERGVTFLKLGNEMWNYIPKINRVIKIPPSMMLQSWMGSDFTNDDLVKESSIVEDYNHKLLGREKLAGFDAYKIELRPKPKAAVVWDKIIEWIRVEDSVPLKAEYYNERGERIRTLLFSDIEKMGGRTIPTKYELIEEKKTGHKTVMILEDVIFDEPIRPFVFTKQNLRRTR